VGAIANMTDDDITTYYGDRRLGVIPFNAWVMFDFEEIIIIDFIIAYIGAYCSAGSFSCNLYCEYSNDGLAWTTAQSCLGVAGSSGWGYCNISVSNIIGRYVRFRLSGTNTIAATWEFGVFETKLNVLGSSIF
jgi:hypothetical protein